MRRREVTPSACRGHSPRPQWRSAASASRPWAIRRSEGPAFVRTPLYANSQGLFGRTFHKHNSPSVLVRSVHHFLVRECPSVPIGQEAHGGHRNHPERPVCPGSSSCRSALRASESRLVSGLQAGSRWVLMQAHVSKCILYSEI